MKEDFNGYVNGAKEKAEKVKDSVKKGIKKTKNN